MKKAEIILVIVSIIGLALKLFNIPFGGLVFLFSLLSLSLIYYPMGFAFFNSIQVQNVFKKESYAGIGWKRIVGAVAAGAVVSTLLIGVLFVIMHYPGGSYILIRGLIGAIVVSIVALVKNRKAKDEYYSLILSRMLFSGSMGIVLLLTTSIFN